MASAPLHSPRISRPRSVTLVIFGVFVLGLVNIFRAVGLVRQSDLQLELGVTLDPRLRLIVAIFWAIVFLAITVALMLRNPKTKVIVPGVLAIYAIYRLALVGLFAQSAYSRGSLLIFVLIYGAVIIYSTWALNRKSAAAYLSGRH